MSFCAYPFIGFYLQAGHNINPCCVYKTDDGPKADDFVKNPLYHLNNGKFYNARKKMLNGEKLSECSSCYKTESEFGRSRRTGANEAWKNYVNESSSNQFDQLRYLEIMIDNLCNFECRMCTSWFSTKLYNRDKFLGKEIKKFSKADISFLRLIDLSYLDRLQLQGGEPFISPNLEIIIDIIEEQKDLKDVIILIVTNGSVLPSNDIIKKLLRFKSIEISISLESTHEVNDYIRYRSDKKLIFKNAKIIEKWPNTEIIFSSNINLYNADTMPETHSTLTNMGYLHHYYWTTNAVSILNNASNEYREWLFDRVKNTKFETLYRNFYKDIQYDETKWNEFIDETKKLDEYYGVRLADYHPDLANFLNI